MKQYIVLQKIGSFPAKVVRDFDDEHDATVFAGLMCNSEDNKSIKYSVAHITTELETGNVSQECYGLQ